MANLLEKLNDKMEICLIDIGQIKAQIKSLEEKIILRDCQNKENVKFNFKILWTMICALFTAISTLAYKVLS